MVLALVAPRSENGIGVRRMLAHGLLYVGKGNLDFIQEQIQQNKPDSWKGYNISNAAKIDNDPMSPMRQWRHDDQHDHRSRFHGDSWSG